MNRRWNWAGYNSFRSNDSCNRRTSP